MFRRKTAVLSAILTVAMVFTPTCLPLAADTNAGALAVISDSIDESSDSLGAIVVDDKDTATDIATAGAGSVIAATVSSAASEETASLDEDTEKTISELLGYTNLGVCVIESGSLNIREEADADAEIVGKMSANAGCEIISDENGWYHITSGKVDGYVSADYIAIGDEAEAIAQEKATEYATVNTTTLYAREEASTDSKVFYLLGEGEKLAVLEEGDEWIKVEVDDDEVYVSAEYVSISLELSTALTMTEVKYGEGVSDVRVSLINYALQFVGNPYVWGGTSLTHGADCSGFVLSVYANYGIYLPHSSRAQANYGRKISASDAQPGDLFFYGGGGISHVAIYIGNGQIVHASNHRDGIKISNAFYRTPITVRSLL